MIQIQWAVWQAGNVANVSQLKLGIIKYFQVNKPKLLEYKVEKYLLHNRGHKVLWTPSYCPGLQPIELFGASGKAAWMYFEGCKMKDAVSHLRAGWCGDEHLFTSLVDHLTGGTVSITTRTTHNMRRGRTIKICGLQCRKKRAKSSFRCVLVWQALSGPLYR